MKWIFIKFRNINEVIVDLGSTIHRQVTDLNEEQMNIVKLFGPGYEKYYV